MRFEILPGLPPYGPPAISLTGHGEREFREGLVVRFYPKGSDPWIGNFVGGIIDCTTVLDHPNGRDRCRVWRYLHYRSGRPCS